MSYEYKPRPQFVAFHERKERWAVLVCHRRCGKSVAAVNDLVMNALLENKENGRYGYIAPFYSQAKTIAWQYLVRYTQGIATKKNESELWVQLHNGSTIRLFGADNENALRGGYFDGVVMDEIQDTKPSVFPEIIRPMLSDRHGWCSFLGTPKGHNILYDLRKLALANQSKWFTLLLKASETKIIAQAELDDARSQMSESQYRQEYEVDFDIAIMGAYYGPQMDAAREEGRITSVPWDKNHHVFTSWDIGFADATAICFWQHYNNKFWFIDYLEGNGEMASYWADKVASKPYKYARHYFPHDARSKEFTSGRAMIEQAKQILSDVAVVRNHFVNDGINAARLALDNCYFDEHKCAMLVENLRSYEHEWDEDNKVFRDKPKHNYASHGADSFRYFAVGWRSMDLSEEERVYETDADRFDKEYEQSMFEAIK